MHKVQKHAKDGRLSDSLNDKMLDLLQSFRKVEEQYAGTPISSVPDVY
jgi:hypothetical protein